MTIRLSGLLQNFPDTTTLRCKTAPDPKDYIALPPPKYGGPTAEPSLTTEPSCKDEARIGQKNSLTRVWGQTGSRPAAPKDLGFASAYLFGAVCPLEGKAAALIMPICNTAAMNHHLCEISSQVAADVHAVVILDGASWHKSHGLVTPSNITLLALPPYSPELNPVARIWHYLRSHWLANSVFRSLADIIDACETAWNRFAADHALIRSLCAVAWAPASSAPYGRLLS